jgi:hypothetical protein
MKKPLLLLLGMLIMLATPAYANLQSANRQTVLNDTTDFIATLGKTGRDKNEILKERRDLRRSARLKAEERRKRAATIKRMKNQQNAIMQKINAPSN